MTCKSTSFPTSGLKLQQLRPSFPWPWSGVILTLTEKLLRLARRSPITTLMERGKVLRRGILDGEQQTHLVATPGAGLHRLDGRLLLAQISAGAVQEYPTGRGTALYAISRLRHSDATILLAVGIDPNVVKRWLGIYGHVTTSMQDEAIDKLDRQFGNHRVSTTNEP